MIRKIAQIIGGELKYYNVLSSLRLIGIEEGPKGLFSLVFNISFILIKIIFELCISKYCFDKEKPNSLTNSVFASVMYFL